MPVVLIVAGSVLLIAAIRGTQQDLFLLLASDFTGPDNFIFWFLSIVVIGAIGYIPRLKPVSDGFLILVILTLFLKKGTGFFDQFNKQVGSTQSAQPVVSSGSTSSGGTNVVRIGGGGGGPGIGVTIGAGGGSIGIGSGGVTI